MFLSPLFIESQAHAVAAVTALAHTLRADKADRFEVEQLRDFVVANVRPAAAGAVSTDDEYDSAAAAGGRVGGGASGKGATAVRAGDTQHADGNMSANALNLLHSILAQHSRDLLNHKEWINKNATNVAALREWVRHLRERVPSTSSAAVGALQQQHQQQTASQPPPSKPNRSHPDEALLTVATDLLAAAPASDASLADSSELPPMQIASNVSAQQQQYQQQHLQLQQVVRQQHQATQQRLADLGESLWQLRNEHSSARLELARRLTWADVETLLVQLFSGGGRSESPTSSSGAGQSGQSGQTSSSSSGGIGIGISSSSSGGSAEFAIHNALPHSLARADGLPANAALSIRVRQLVSQQQQKQQQQLQTQTQTQAQAQAPAHQPFGPLSWPHPPPRIGAGAAVADSTAANHVLGSGISSGEGGAAPSRPFTAAPSRASNASPTHGGSENRFVLPSVPLPQQHAQYSSGMPANGAHFSSASSSSLSTALPPIANDALLPSHSLSDALSSSVHSQAKQLPHIAASSRMAPARASAVVRGNK